LEDTEDLIDDLRQALDKLPAGAAPGPARTASAEKAEKKPTNQTLSI
jgi:hypothetical protein